MGAFRRPHPPITQKRLIRKDKKLSLVKDMECPHCLKAIASIFSSTLLDIYAMYEPKKYSLLFAAVCPACYELIIYNKFMDERPASLTNLRFTTENFFKAIGDAELLVPKSKKPKQFPPDSGVPRDYVKDYEEAYAVLEISPKASAALSRRLLQRLLTDKGIRPRNIDEEIKDAIETQGFTSDIKDVINNVKIIGKYAAHPNMTTALQVQILTQHQHRRHPNN